MKGSERGEHDDMTDAEPGRLAVYHERIAKALDRLISLRGDAPDELDRDAKPAQSARS